MNHIARRDAGGAQRGKLVADMSLALINRTGAYHVCREIAESCADLIDARRYWRVRRSSLPGNNVRRVLARLMLLEIGHPSLGRWLPSRRRPGESVLYMDPLYVLGEHPAPHDIVLCHDMGPLTHPEFFGPETEESYRQAFDLISRGRPGMVFVSEASRDAFTEIYGSDFPFLEVIPLFVRALDRSAAGRPPAGVERPFLLTVGALDLRKNHLRSLQAFAQTGLAAEGYSFVLCGPRGNGAEQAIALADRTAGVTRLGYVDDAELQWLYRNATGFILPSLLEGFGMPALEASQYGLLSVVSNAAVQREAVGDGAIFVDATSVDDIARGMRHIVDMDAAERGQRLDLALAHARSLTRERFIASWRAVLERPPVT
jgi:glycosyltransferase involved in cell wall biosynthesis